MMKDNELIEQLQQLPNEVQAPDRWVAIQAAIEHNKQQIAKEPKRSVERFNGWKGLSYAVAASFVLFAMGIGFNQYQSANTPVMDSKLQMTLASLQKANSFYYSELGYQLEQANAGFDEGVWQSLKDIRHSQALYTQALYLAPANIDLQKRLIKSYQKERHLLKKLVS